MAASHLQWITSYKAAQLNIQFLQGSAATDFRWGGRSNTIFFRYFIPEYYSERIIKIGPHLLELWGIICVPHFFETQCRLGSVGGWTWTKRFLVRQLHVAVLVHAKTMCCNNIVLRVFVVYSKEIQKLSSMCRILGLGNSISELKTAFCCVTLAMLMCYVCSF